jgi:CheY-like chemotaxis protein
LISREVTREPIRGGNGVFGDRVRILLVDNEPLLVKSYARFLHRKCGHDVVTASGGAEALAELEADELFDLIFCDLAMPEIDGIAVHRAIRELYPGLVGRFTFLTGGLTTERANLYLTETGAHVLTKPVSRAEFDRCLADVGVR